MDELSRAGAKVINTAEPQSIAGGAFYLSGEIPRLTDMQQFELQLIAAGHCTGWRALNVMSTVFVDELVPLAVGKRISA